MEKHSLLQKIVNGLKNMCYIWAKEMRSTVTDEGVLIFFILVPIAYPLLYSWIYNNEVVRDVPVAIVDQSHSQTSRRFIRAFDASPETKTAYFCDNIDEARDLVAKQVVRGVLYFPSDFSHKLNRGEQAHIGVYCDMSLMLTYKAIYQTAQSVATDINAGIQIARSTNYTDRDEELTTQPLDVEEVPLFNTTGGYGNAIIPGVLILILQQTLLLGIGLAAGTARENNRYRELIPISKHYVGVFRIVFGKALCYFMVFALMAAYLTRCVPHFFRFTTMAGGPELVALLTPFLLAVIFFGMALSALVRYRENVMLLVVFTSLPLLFMTGISWPQTNMPAIWQYVASVFPSTFGVRGFLRLSSMGGTLHDIRPELIALWIQAALYFFATCAVYRFQINHTRQQAFDRLDMLKRKAVEAKSNRNSKE